jgi:hypothetical protein
MADPVVVRRAQMEKIWRKELDDFGPDVVRTRYTARLPVTDHMPYPDAAFVQKWLDEHDRKAKCRTHVLTFLSIVAMIAACIAAWPVVVGWLR